ncbi:GTP pyrophosphokinase, partial [Candidatus Magnetomorum sp. HK-1]
YIKEPNISLVTDAYYFAKKIHHGQKRRSGSPYISHPVSVAEILTTLEVDETTIAAGLLHDTLEDSNITRQDLVIRFGETITHLIEGVTKLGQITLASKEELQAENFRKMFLAMATDIRVIVIKLVDRLHNMRTLKYLPYHKIQRIALETSEIYAPLAHRLGMSQIKWELEDLCFRYLNPEEYNT